MENSEPTRSSPNRDDPGVVLVPTTVADICAAYRGDSSDDSDDCNHWLLWGRRPHASTWIVTRCASVLPPDTVKLDQCRGQRNASSATGKTDTNREGETVIGWWRGAVDVELARVRADFEPSAPFFDVSRDKSGQIVATLQDDDGSSSEVSSLLTVILYDPQHPPRWCSQPPADVAAAAANPLEYHFPHGMPVGNCAETFSFLGSPTAQPPPPTRSEARDDQGIWATPAQLRRRIHLLTAPTSAADRWRAVSDAVLGAALALAAYAGIAHVTAHAPAMLDSYLVDHVLVALEWLKGWPAGLKLNNQYARFLGDLCTWVVQGWHLVAVGPMGRFLFSTLLTDSTAAYATAGVTGAVAAFPVMVAAMLDAWRMLTAHIRVLHVATARLGAWQARTCAALLSLFLGKMRNPLRGRVDAGEFAADQLLMGTLLLTVLVFLFPTVAAYWAFFGVAHFMVAGPDAMARAILAHPLPGAVVARYLWNPTQFPGRTRLVWDATRGAFVVKSEQKRLLRVLYDECTL